MSIQKRMETYTAEQIAMLNLEKKYFNFLWEIFSSEEFEKSLKDSEAYIIKNYEVLHRKWDNNKFKVPFERIMRHLLYKKLIENDLIVDIYPSPVSGDMGIVTKDAIINIDAKTINAKTNSGDIKWLQYLPNQTSFRHVRILHEEYGLEVESNLPEYDTYNNGSLPVLSYFLKAIYYDDNKSFSLDRNEFRDSLSLVCFPNGVLSPLFENELISGQKTYLYYKLRDGKYYKPKLIGSKEVVDNWIETGTFFAEVKKIIPDTLKWEEVERETARIKYSYYDIENNTLWIVVRRGTAGNFIYNLEAVVGVDTPRVDLLDLKDRFDGENKHWLGYKSKKFTL
ncbi:hypothetical protein D1B33_15240 [Lysinibacillus yapensis]|uniref:Uncharacterized protein n=1 Tax=Ureibacillus yapensis TaxID=2304605 RepID=A0A396S509_9BACL|nr:hypothetical protein [Lysinibacillus yapensis]RHW33400.1 hypothetical protein D1B33_15240 [Lysinibacillus yapensis]